MSAAADVNGTLDEVPMHYAVFSALRCAHYRFLKQNI